jgi:enhancing lycopene biosynthesis protein 2
MKKIAVVLCGSGYLDGSEIRESVAVLWALAREGASAQCFAPDEAQSDVVNCLSGQAASGESRNQLVEAARIARGNVKPLSELHARDYAGLVIPGGYGAAKNLCTFAANGSGGKVNPGMQRVLEEFRAAGKPIGAVCIAPAVLALAFPNKGFELTVGARGEASAEIEKLGHRHVEKSVHEWHVDRAHRIVTSPAYMYDGAALHELFAGVHGLVKDVLQFA